MKSNLKILTSFWFLIGLIVLLLNDFIFKEMYGNWVAGKLSDFAGLFIFPLFWTAVFSKYKKPIFFFTALFFVFWKSPYSQCFIDCWNCFMFFKITRVVDFTDLMALLVLPIAFQYENKFDAIKRICFSPEKREARFTKSLRFSKSGRLPLDLLNFQNLVNFISELFHSLLGMSERIRLNPAIPFVLTLFSFFATSLPFNDIEVEKEYSFDFPKDTLVGRIFRLPTIQEQVKNTCIRDSAGVYWVYRMSEQDTIWTEEELIYRFVQDSMYLDVDEEFCLNGYGAEIVISGGDQKSTLNLNRFIHRCRKNEWKKSPVRGDTEKEKLINSFESKIISGLRK